MKANTDVCLCLKKGLELVPRCAVSCEGALIFYSYHKSSCYSDGDKSEGRAASAGFYIEAQDQLNFTFQGLNDVLKLIYITSTSMIV